MSTVLPTIEHATVTLNERNRVVVQMNDGWVFWLRFSYVDENGEMYEPAPEQIAYSRYGVFSPATDFGLFVVVPENEVLTQTTETEETDNANY